MSGTTMTAEANGYATLTGRPGVPFGRLVRTELRKLTDTRAGKWLLIAIVAITLLVMVIMVFSASTKDLTYNKFVDYTLTPQKLLLPVLGILAITSEWSQRTGLVTFTLAPNRARVLLAKVVSVMILGLIVILIAFAAAAVGNLAAMGLRHGADGSWALGASGFGEIILIQLIGLLEGVAFGMLLLISAAAIVLYYVVPNAWSTLFGTVSGLKHAGPWVDLNNTPLYTHHMTGQAWLQVLVATAIWVFVPFVLGLIRVRRSEVKSG
jgi:ABC-2 type transport system permease protein